MSVRRIYFRTLLVGLLALPLVALAGPRYSVHVLAGVGSVALDINAGGQVAGRYLNGNADQRAFQHSGNALLDLGTLGGATSSANAINDSGQVVGMAQDAMGVSRAFSYAGGALLDLGTLGGAAAAAYGVNGAGRIVGLADVPPGAPGEYGRAFSYAGGVMADLGTLPGGGELSTASAVNSAGQIVGESSFGVFSGPEFAVHAFLYENGAMTDIGTLGGLHSTASAINEAGVISGEASTAIDFGNGHTVRHAYLYVNGIMVDLGALGDLFAGSAARDVNNAGQAVGWSDMENSFNRHGFLHEAGQMLDLNSLIDPLSGWTIRDAFAINDLQQIAATACMAGDCYAVRLDLAGEVPEPESRALALLGFALLGLSLRLTRRNTRFSRW